jgi:hypothetical protein
MTAHMAFSTSSEIIVSQTSASAWTLAHGSARISERKRSASRCLRTTTSARCLPSAVRRIGSMVTSPSTSIFLTISETEALVTPSQSATLAWIGSIPSSSSSQMASAYSRYLTL